MSKKAEQKAKQSLMEQNLQGFTIVEFSLATAFIATLLISITVVAGMLTQIYQKGLTLKALNSTGRGLIDEFTSNINAAPSVDTTSLCSSYFKSGNTESDDWTKACEKDHANKFIYQERTGKYGEVREAEGEHDVQLGGVFCTGNYSYIWNTYYGSKWGADGKSSAMVLRYLKKNTDTGEYDETPLQNFRLAQVYDPTYRVCSSLVDNGESVAASGSDRGYNKDMMDPDDKGPVTANITQLANGSENHIPEPTDGLLTASDVNLQLYELTVFPISQDEVTLRTFMTGTFILGTERGNINIERSGDYCDVENYTDDNGSLLTIGSEFTYCGINKFNFAARTAGR